MLKSFQKKELMSFVTGCDSQTILTDDQRKTYDALVKKIDSGYPFEYVVQSCDFFGCKLFLNEDVLIPRVETEILAEMVVCHVQKQKSKQNVLDLCSGSGALGISIKKHTNASVTLSDICPKALWVAKRNAEANNCSVCFNHGDLFENLEGKKFDVVVCNPPYISTIEYEGLDDSVRMHEPKLALVGGNHGFEVYEKISKNISSFLKKGAKVFFEIGYNQKKHVEKIFSAPFFTQLKTQKDYSGLDRFFFLEFEPN